MVLHVNKLTNKSIQISRILPITSLYVHTHIHTGCTYWFVHCFVHEFAYSLFISSKPLNKISDGETGIRAPRTRQKQHHWNRERILPCSRHEGACCGCLGNTVLNMLGPLVGFRGELHGKDLRLLKQILYRDTRVCVSDLQRLGNQRIRDLRSYTPAPRPGPTNNKVLAARLLAYG